MRGARKQDRRDHHKIEHDGAGGRNEKYPRAFSIPMKMAVRQTTSI